MIAASWKSIRATAPCVYCSSSGRATPLARLPLVPGLVPRVTAAVVDYDAELQVAGQVSQLEDRLTDLVARREVLMGRIRRRLQGGKLEQAALLLDNPEAAAGSCRISAGASFNCVPAARPKTPGHKTRNETKFNALQRLVDQYLVNPPIDRLHDALEQARAG